MARPSEGPGAAGRMEQAGEIDGESAYEQMRQPVGERLQRELQRQAQAGAVERGDLLLVGGGGRAGRAMEARVQYRPTPQRLRRLSPGP